MSESGTQAELAVVDVDDLFRFYSEVGKDGYPPAWHESVKHAVRELAGHRCVRCLHPYRNGEHGNGEWSECDNRCTHAGPIRWATFENETGWAITEGEEENRGWAPGSLVQTTLAAVRPFPRGAVEARWRILTVHHLDGDKANCRWWNLASLCQRCHLTIQGRVQLHRVYPWEHSEWFKPYAAGWYAHAYLNEDLTREQTIVRLDELLALELSAA